jgi:ankyrin repeat protein
MKIIVSGAAVASVLDSDEEVTDPRRLRKLDGLDYSKDRCCEYLDRSLQEIGVTGGAVRLAFDSGEKRLRVVTEYHAPRRLKPAELKKLAAETVGQWSDGIGESEFRHRKQLGVDVDLYPRGAEKARVEQIDDGKKVKAPRIDALVKAIRDRKPKQAERLLAGGAEVNGKDRDGEAPLHLACLYGYLGLARLILERGADARPADKSGSTPLAYLAMANLAKAKAEASVSVARALLEKGAGVDARDKEGITPLMWAVNRGNLPLTRFLIDSGADVNARDRVKYNESTVLMYAQRVDAAELLLRHGADPSACNASGENAWEYALLNDHVRGYRRLADLLRSYQERWQG